MYNNNKVCLKRRVSHALNSLKTTNWNSSLSVANHNTVCTQIELWEWSSVLLDSTIRPDKNAVSYAFNCPNTCKIPWENARHNRRNVSGNVSCLILVNIYYIPERLLRRRKRKLRRPPFTYFINSQGRTWHISEQFHTTSATVNNITVYVGDVAQYRSREQGISYGKVQTFFSKVLKVFFVVNPVCHICD